MKTIIDFMKKLKDEKFEVCYSDGYVIVFNSNGKMYAECENRIKDIKAIFSFDNADDLQDKCTEIMGYEIRFCDYCGCPINCGYTDDDADFYNCEICFPKDLRVDFIHRLEFGEVSGHRVLIKRGPGNRGPTECGTTHFRVWTLQKCSVYMLLR